MCVYFTMIIATLRLVGWFLNIVQYSDLYLKTKSDKAGRFFLRVSV
jgi:hypothetical protein